MEERLSRKWAVINVVMIGLFHIISGIWEYLVGLTRAENIGSGKYFLLDVSRSYGMNLGRITIFLGIAILLFRFRFIRWLTLILAWWNLFAAPLIDIWWLVYDMEIEKISASTSLLMLFIGTTIIILIMTVSRLYIISMLKISKAGYLFLKRSQDKS